MNDTTSAPLARFGGRKFIFAMTVLAVASVLVWFEKITDSIWSTVVLAAIAIFSIVNGYQHVASAAATSPKAS